MTSHSRGRMLISASALSMLLAGCANPLAGVDRLQDVTLSEDSGDGVAIVPSQDEIERPGLFARLLSSRDDASADQTSSTEGATGQDTGSSADPNSDAAVSAKPIEQTGAETALADTNPSQKKGLFAFLKPKTSDNEKQSVEVLANVPAGEDAPAVERQDAEIVASAEVGDDVVATPAKEPPKGVLAWLRREKSAPLDEKAQQDGWSDVVAASADLSEKDLGTQAQDTAQNTDQDTAQQPQIRTASLGPSLGANRSDTPGLFASLFRSTPKDAPKPKGIPFGTHLAFGETAPVCDYPKGKLGKLVAQYPEKKPIYRLYDSQPGEQAAHAFYVTGFADGCLRQVTASVAIFGSVAVHEHLRYAMPADMHPYSDTDQAYEKIKRQVCKVGRKEPCGENLAALEQNTVFLSLYGTYVSAQDWANLLIHNGELVATDLKSGDS